MNSQKEMPLCSFGPGGDFRKEYVPDAEEVYGHYDGHSLRTLLESFSQALSEKLLLPIGMEVAGCNPHAYRPAPQTNNRQQRGYKIESHANKNANTANIQAVSNTKTLFPDDEGACRTSGKKPNNGVRALRRTPRKRVSDPLEQQGALF
jgi:hypothetical protein